jgi:hypothetical protein
MLVNVSLKIEMDHLGQATRMLTESFSFWKRKSGQLLRTCSKHSGSNMQGIFWLAERQVAF